MQGYFEILADTLIGYTLPSFRPRAKIKEIAHPKFYFFDCGVVRALQHETRTDASNDAAGHLFETYFINEIRALNSYYSLGLELFYWQAEHGTEVDLIVVNGQKRISFEIKHSKTWKTAHNKGLQSLLNEKVIEKGFGIYVGDKKLMFDSIEVLPYKEALISLKAICTK